MRRQKKTEMIFKITALILAQALAGAGSAGLSGDESCPREAAGRRYLAPAVHMDTGYFRGAYRQWPGEIRVEIFGKEFLVKEQLWNSIRKAEAKDAQAIGELSVRISEIDGDDTLVKEEITDLIKRHKKNVLLVLESEGRIIGYVFAYHNVNNLWIIENLAVAKNEEKKGVGTTLLFACFKELEKRNAVQIVYEATNEKSASIARKSKLLESKGKVGDKEFFLFAKADFKQADFRGVGEDGESYTIGAHIAHPRPEENNPYNRYMLMFTHGFRYMRFFKFLGAKIRAFFKHDRPYYEPLLNEGLFVEAVNQGFHAFLYAHFEPTMDNVLGNKVEEHWLPVQQHCQKEFPDFRQIHIADSAGAIVTLEGICSRFFDENGEFNISEGFEQYIERVYFVNPAFAFKSPVHNFMKYVHNVIWRLLAWLTGRGKGYLLNKILAEDYKVLFARYREIQNRLAQLGKEELLPELVFVVNEQDTIVDTSVIPEGFRRITLNSKEIDHFTATRHPLVVEAILDDLKTLKTSNPAPDQAFYSGAAIDNQRNPEMAVEDLIKQARSVIALCKGKDREINLAGLSEIIEQINKIDNVDALIIDSEEQQSRFHPYGHIKHVLTGEEVFLRATVENIAQHVRDGVACIIREDMGEYIKITVMDNGEGFINMVDGLRVTIIEAVAWGASFGDKQGYDNGRDRSRKGRALTFAVGKAADLTLVEQPGESAVIIPDKIYKNYIKPNVVYQQETNNRLAMVITGYFYKKQHEFDKKNIWRKFLIEELKLKIIRELPIFLELLDSNSAKILLESSI